MGFRGSNLSQTYARQRFYSLCYHSSLRTDFLRGALLAVFWPGNMDLMILCLGLEVLGKPPGWYHVVLAWQFKVGNQFQSLGHVPMGTLLALSEAMIVSVPQYC